jgi:hypothetical protein
MLGFRKKLHLFHVFLKSKKMDIVTSLWLSITIWPKYQKPFTNHFVNFMLGFRRRF